MAESIVSELARPQSYCESREILGMRIDATSYDDVANALIQGASSGSGAMVCVATAHMVMEAHDDPAFRSSVNGADRVTPDGMPLVWLLRHRGVPDANRVYGPRITDQMCARAARLAIPVGFLGGDPATLEALGERLTARHPGLDIAFLHSPPFREPTPEEDRAIVERIRASGAQILFVGLGCPKQERWMASHREQLGCAMVGVGAAFDFLAGVKSQAPAWMQGNGLEWLFRLGSEPQRLWRRYLIGNSRFIYHVAREQVGLARPSSASSRRARAALAHRPNATKKGKAVPGT